MKAIAKILGVLISILGSLAAIKTLAPPQITYFQLFSDALFISGWGVCLLLSLVIVYQEIKHTEYKINTNKLITERDMDKNYLQSELEKSSISLNHLTSRLEIQKPIPINRKYEENNEI